MIEWFLRTAKMAIKATIAGICLQVICVSANAQQSMRIEELENFILKKKSELSEAIDQRDSTLDKRAEIEQKRTEQAERQQALEDELRALCDEREAAEPGSLNACLSELNIPAE